MKLKKMFALLTAVLLVTLALMPSMALAATKTGTIVTASGKNANLRDAPSLDDDESNVIGIVRYGAKVDILGSSGRFYEVEDKYGRTGYIHKTLVDTGSGTSSSTSSSQKTTTAALNLREGAGTSYDVIRVIPKGAKVTVLKESGSWTKVKYDGDTGYVFSSYLK